MEADIAARVDSYFTRTKRIVGRFGDKRVTYAVFLRRPVVCAPRPMLEWLNAAGAARGIAIDIEPLFQEGDWIGAGEPIAYISGSMAQLSDLETILLQKLGAACVAAHNAYQMCMALPNVAFLAMDARHCAGAEMQDLMATAIQRGFDRSAAFQADGAFIRVAACKDGNT